MSGGVKNTVFIFSHMGDFCISDFALSVAQLEKNITFL